MNLIIRDELDKIRDELDEIRDGTKARARTPQYTPIPQDDPEIIMLTPKRPQHYQHHPDAMPQIPYGAQFSSGAMSAYPQQGVRRWYPQSGLLRTEPEESDSFLKGFAQGAVEGLLDYRGEGTKHYLGRFVVGLAGFGIGLAAGGFYQYNKNGYPVPFIIVLPFAFAFGADWLYRKIFKI